MFETVFELATGEEPISLNQKSASDCSNLSRSVLYHCYVKKVIRLNMILRKYNCGYQFMIYEMFSLFLIIVVHVPHQKRFHSWRYWVITKPQLTCQQSYTYGNILYIYCSFGLFSANQIKVFRLNVSCRRQQSSAWQIILWWRGCICH